MSFLGYLESPYLLNPYLSGIGLNPTAIQMDLRIEGGFSVNSQFEPSISGSTSTVRTQFERKIFEDGVVCLQFSRKIIASGATAGTIRGQFTRSIAGNSGRLRSEFGRGSISHAYVPGYMTGDYLSGDYTAPRMAASLRSQIIIAQGFRVNLQIVHAIYNTTNIRILAEFPSRGTSGSNWSVIAGGTESGDFGVNNLNSDIVEQVYRSTSKVVTIQCDTEISQGVFSDTLAILGHNFTRSASVIMQGSNDPTFSTSGMSETLAAEPENMYWISPTLPAASYRYWRFTINDPTNTANIQIGCIVFGSATIFSGESFVDDVVRRKTHFADRVRTEGYSAVSNDRALKRAVSLTFRRLDFNRDNYTNLVEIIDYARTSLKCLWIPTPDYPSRFAVFGKLSEIPVENHKSMGKDADYIDMDITIDEAL